MLVASVKCVDVSHIQNAEQKHDTDLLYSATFQHLLLCLLCNTILMMMSSHTCSLTAMTTDVRSLSSSFSMISFFRVRLKSLQKTHTDKEDNVR